MKCLAVGMVSYSLTQDVDLRESGSTDLIKCEPPLCSDASTEENDEAEGVSLPIEDSSSVNLQYLLENALNDFTAVKNEVSYNDFLDTSTELEQNKKTLLQNEDSDTDDLPLSRIKNEPPILNDNNENSSASSILSVKNEFVDLYDIVVNKPIVYTTRLDDMIVINNFNCSLDKPNLFKNILIESKPKFNSCFYDNSSRTHDDEMSFKNLVEKLDMINMKSKQGQTPGNKAHEHDDPVPSLNFISHSVNVSERSKHERTHDDEISFKNLVEKLDMINMKSKEGQTPGNKSHEHDDPVQSLNFISNSVNISERSRNLLKSCKPFSIILKDIMKNKRFKRIFSGKASKLDANRHKDKNDTLQSFEMVKVIARWRRPNKKTKIITIMLNNIKENISEIYLLDSQGIIRQHYRNNVTKAEIYEQILQKQIPYRLSINFCCWFRREAVIKSFFSSIDIHVPFMKSRHHCNGTHCTCCCNPFVSINRRSDDDVQIIDVEPKNIIQSLYNLYNKNELFISTALRYTPKTQVQPKKSSKQADLHLSNAKILLINNRTNENEFYELGANGEVVIYTKNKKQDEKLYISQTNLKHFTYCCWFERENIIKKISSMVSSKTLLFIKRTPHDCPLDNCCCCCKLINDIHLKKRPVLKINIPMSSIHTSNNNKPTLVQIKFNEKSQTRTTAPKPVTKKKHCNVIDLTGEPVKSITKTYVNSENQNQHSKTISSKQNLTDHKTNVTSFNSNKTVQKSNVSSLKSNKTSPKSNVTSLNSNKTVQKSNVSSLKSNKTSQKSNVTSLNSNKTVQKTNVSSVKSNKTDPKSNTETSDPYAAGSTIPKQNFKKLSDSISQRFSNVAMVINSEGKLAAEINNSKRELSNADLTTLSNFLSIAQKEVDNLELPPGTNIKIINNPTPYAIAVPNIKKVTSILNNLNEDGSKKLSTITPDVANKTLNMSKRSSVSDRTASTLKDDVYGRFTNLYYANRINMLKAFSQTKNVMSSAKKTAKKTPLNTRLNKNTNSSNEFASLNGLIDSLTDEIACEMTPPITEKTQSSNTTKFRMNPLKRTLGNPGPVHGVFSKFPASTKVEDKSDERIDVFTHNTIKPNHNTANQNINKRPRLETTQLNEVNASKTSQAKIIVPQPFPLPCENSAMSQNSYAFLPSTSQVSNQTSNVATQVDIASNSGNTSGVRNHLMLSSFTHVVDKKDSISVFPVASSPAQIPDVNLVPKNIIIGTASNLQPLTLACPQTTIVKEESPDLDLPLPVHPLGNEADEKLGDEILGM